MGCSVKTLLQVQPLVGDCFLLQGHIFLLLRLRSCITPPPANLRYTGCLLCFCLKERLSSPDLVSLRSEHVVGEGGSSTPGRWDLQKGSGQNGSRNGSSADPFWCLEPERSWVTEGSASVSLWFKKKKVTLIENTHLCLFVAHARLQIPFVPFFMWRKSPN